MSHDTGFPDDVVELIWDRDRGCCARCGLGLIRERRVDDWAIHHREPRGRGGVGKKVTYVNRPSNGVLLCNTCHDKVESDRRQARLDGWLVSKLGIIRPIDIHVKHALLGLVYLTDDGGWLRA